MTSSTPYGPVLVTVLVRVIAGFCATGVSTVSSSVTGGGVGLPGVAGGVPEAVAVFCTLPAATSAAVTV